MCRLLGVIANKPVDFKFSLLEATNNFRGQSSWNYHGWGLAFLDRGRGFKIYKKAERADESEDFYEISIEKKAPILIAHVRFASSGSISDNNCHPFSFNGWVFAHNGTVNRERIKGLLKDEYSADFESEPIDSEVYFRYVIQSIEEEGDVISGIEKATRDVIEDCAGANFLMSDGKKLYAYCYDNELHYLERDPHGPFASKSEETAALIESKAMANEKAVLVASEELTRGENWIPLEDNTLLVVDQELNTEVIKFD